MKKSYLFFFAVCTLLLSGCAWQIPEKVSVKTQAEYNFSMGDFTKSFDSDFGTDSVFKNMNVSNARVFDYFPGKKDEKIRQYYLRIPLLEIPVDFSAYFKNTGISESVENMSFKKDIEIPTVYFFSSETVDMSEVSRQINAGLSIAGVATSGSLGFSINFSKVSYSSGNMVITCGNMPDGSSVTLNNGEATKVGFFNGGVAKINLSSYSLYDEGMTISFSNPLSDNYVGVIEENSEISEAQGVTIPQEIPVPITLRISSISKDDSFEYCVVNEGLLYTNIDLPKDWKNIDMGYDISASGGMSVTSPRSEGPEKIIDLRDQIITSGSTNVNAVVYLRLADASYSSKINPVFTSYSDIKSFKKVAINNSEVSTGLSEKEKMSEVMLTTVKSIKLTSSGLKGTYINTLPQGNDIQVVASSGFLGLDGGTDTMRSQTETGKLSIMTPANFEKDVVIAENPVQPNEYNSWDFQMNIHFPGYTAENPNRIVVSNVAPGEKYKIGLEVSPETNWKQIVINSEDISQKEVSKLGFNLASIFDSFGDTLGVNLADKVQLDSIPVYLYCTKPTVAAGNTDPFTSTSFFGSINMFCGKETNGTIQALKNSGGNNIEKEFCKEEVIPFVNVPNVEISENSIITDISNFEYSKRQDIAELVNQSSDDSDLYIDFNVSFTNSSSAKTITIVPSMLDDSGSNCSIGIVAVVVIPLRFKVINDDINIDIMKMMGNETGSDLFGRSSASSDTSITQYMNVIRSVAIKYEEKALPFYANPEISLLLDMKYADEPKKYSLSSGEIAVYAGEIERMMAVYPLCPDVTMSIQKGSRFTIPRNVGLSMNLSLQLVTDGSITLFGGN